MLQSLIRPALPTSLSFFQRNLGLALLLSLALAGAAACGDDGDGNGPGNDPADASSTADATLSDGASADANNPENPLGEGPKAVDLGAATDLAAPGSYVLLAKTAITNVTGSTITGGHLGLSPEAASGLTGFAQTLDASGEYSTSDSVVPDGKIYASDYAVPTPSNLTTAVLAMEAAYTDAAGRTNPDSLNLGDGEIGGETLEPGLYTWGSDVTIPEDVTIAGGADDVWIFQISGNLDLSAAKSVLLSGGADPGNIFWQVAGQATLHADSHFEGVILSKTAITLQTNASMNGRALAQTQIAIDDNDITAP